MSNKQVFIVDFTHWEILPCIAVKGFSFKMVLISPVTFDFPADKHFQFVCSHTKAPYSKIGKFCFSSYEPEPL